MLPGYAPRQSPSLQHGAGDSNEPDDWTRKWFAGFEHHTAHAALADAFAKPAGEDGTQFEWLKSLADKPAEVARRLRTETFLAALADVVTTHLVELQEQAFANGQEQNAKFVSSSDAKMSYGIHIRLMLLLLLRKK